MFVILVDDPIRTGVREYLSEDHETLTPNLQAARAFVEKHDESILPWPSEEAASKNLEELFTFQDRNPIRIPVAHCDKCASLQQVGKLCGICGG